MRCLEREVLSSHVFYPLNNPLRVRKHVSPLPSDRGLALLLGGADSSKYAFWGLPGVDTRRSLDRILGSKGCDACGDGELTEDEHVELV